ncbi:MAG: MazG nucleotide pyrophosphohydrolase domain-containing protein [archaeon]|jgi:NTP pyrophosphatase (non-canonical NTP hydrolase)|nr:nucleotide pyrophosphohydrolase [archaeon]MDD2478109.1 MazG nucleotide pyrophosphohydrolase domain-containing protein [Candidatus ainarchaeum sp.]MDD3084801.1 MazG nucleotide pyrophosphohydrolase domain-containing protein [Candidatus ainarchaeum sp.]MDD4221361.1 MazG nucleotide pyrophosphohydrolase domain-containing protein [Candidatus ainarchaeum sp.]
MKEIQEKIRVFCEKNNLKNSIEIGMLDITSEIGELSKEVIKGTNYGVKDFSKTENTDMEFGDVLFSLIVLANKLDVDLNKSLDMALEKYKKRIEKGNMGSK